MSEFESTTVTSTVPTPLPPEERLSTSSIDASLRWPLLFLLGSSIVWLVVGTLLGLIGSIQFHGSFLADCPWMTVGRIRPAATNALLYGFASQAAFGVLFWMLCRLGNVRFAYQVGSILAGKVWNLGVLVGVVGILGGATTGFEWLEMPRFAAAMLFASYLLIGLCAVGTFQMRRVRELYPSQWFIFAALFWFPWIYTAANYLLVIDPVRGTLQAVVAAWFTGGLRHLWLGLIGLAIIYYFIPKLANKPLHNSSLAAFAFWTILFFGSWTGLSSLQGAPVPRWVGSVGVAAALCMLVPLISNAMNWFSTSCPIDLFKKNSEARFFIAATLAYLLSGLTDFVLACPVIRNTVGLTLVNLAAKGIFLHGFVACALLGAIYYILPRVMQVNWPIEGLVRLHFVLQVAGAVLIFVGLAVGGWVQGTKLAEAIVLPVLVAKSAAPFIGLATLGALLLLAGSGLLALNLVKMARLALEPLVRSLCAECCSGTTIKKAGVKS